VQDRLAEIMRIQKDLMEDLTRSRGIQFTKEEWILKLLDAIDDEKAEIRAELNWKWWKNPKEVNWPATKREIADMWLFLVQMTIIAEITPDEIYELYQEKEQEFKDRQAGKSEKKGYELHKDDGTRYATGGLFKGVIDPTVECTINFPDPEPGKLPSRDAMERIVAELNKRQLKNGR
jgi:dUTPase